MIKMSKKIFLVFTVLCVTLIIPFISSSAFGYVSTMGAEVEAKFIVYPDGTVEISAKYNHTSPHPNVGPHIQLGADITKTDDANDISVNATVTLPAEEASKFPFNATGIFMKNKYLNGTLNSCLNASIILPNNLPEQRINFSGFPFNSTDFTITANYVNKSFNGVITVHLVSGLSLGDINLNFNGNLTRLVLNDSLTVFYNQSLPIPGFPKLSEDYLKTVFIPMINETLQSELPSISDGLLKCTTFNVHITSIDQNSAEVSYLIIIQGDFLKFLANNLAKSTPPASISSILTLPSLPNSTVYSILNSTVYLTRKAKLTLSYSRATRKIDVQACTEINGEEYFNLTAKSYLDAYQSSILKYPPEVQQSMMPLLQFMESLLNRTYCSVSSYTETIFYGEGQIDYKGIYTVKGDLNAEINYIKNEYVNMMNSTSPKSVKWIVTVLKKTSVDLSNFQFNLNISEYSATLNFAGVKVKPPINMLNATCFKLKQFFNITSSPYESPRRNERLKIIVQGGSNGTHSVTLTIDKSDPKKIPNPDEIEKGNVMVWNNQSVSKLQSLIFKVWKGYTETVYNPSSIKTDNPLIIDAKKTANCILTLTKITKPATINIKNLTSLPSTVKPPSGTYKLIGNYLQITASPSDTTVNVTIKIYYNPQQLSKLGMNENSLKIFYWDNSTSSWVPVESHVNSTEHYVWANVDHLSVWALMGEPSPQIMQPWIVIVAAIVIIIIIAVVVIAVLKRRKPSA